MKKLMLTLLVGASALSFAAGARAEGDAAINTMTQTNTDAAASSADTSYAHGTMHKTGDTVSATSTTGTPEGTASATVDANGNASATNGAKMGSGTTMSKEQVMEVQTKLKAAGYDVDVDGDYGDKTKTALRDYQKSKSMSVTGEMDDSTLTSLGMHVGGTGDVQGVEKPGQGGNQGHGNN